jgi:hypothetical protein
LWWCRSGHSMVQCGSCLCCTALASTCCRGLPPLSEDTVPIGVVACFTGEAVPQAPGSWVRPAESCVVSQYNCAPPVKPQKK